MEKCHRKEMLQERDVRKEKYHRQEMSEKSGVIGKDVT